MHHRTWGPTCLTKVSFIDCKNQAFFFKVYETARNPNIPPLAFYDCIKPPKTGGSAGARKEKFYWIWNSLTAGRFNLLRTFSPLLFVWPEKDISKVPGYSHYAKIPDSEEQLETRLQCPALQAVPCRVLFPEPLSLGWRTLHLKTCVFPWT